MSGKHTDRNRYPPGWDAQRVRKLIEEFEQQTEEEAVAEDESAWQDQTRATMDVPVDLVPAVRELIARRSA